MSAAISHLLSPAEPEICVGMPQMNSLGLSENWLLKEAGDRHWRHLAAQRSQAPGALRDAQGRRVYAAFTQVHLRQAQLHGVQEDACLQLHLRGRPVGRSQHYSQQILSDASGHELARLEMLSIFVVRERQGDNHSVVRVPMGPPGAGWGTPAGEAEAQACAEAARAVRAGAWLERFAPAELVDGLALYSVNPCPLNDFNGAGLLYFASFQALTDRAHWAWGLACEREPVRERQMVFHGNVNVGEGLALSLLAQQRTRQGHWTWTQVRRASDGRVVADVATHRGGVAMPL